MPTKRDIERWVEQREADEPDGDLEVTITDTVVSSSWEPPADNADDVPEPGTETTQVARGEHGEWTSKTVDGDGERDG